MSNQHKFIFDVKYQEKEQAKIAGLKWDAILKKWYKNLKTDSNQEAIIKQLSEIPFKVYDVMSPYFDNEPDIKESLLRYTIKHYRTPKPN